MEQKKQNIKIVILSLTQDLQRLPLLLINNLRGRSRIKYGLTSLYNSGFTLIELLVVVLIIGILAAVAVPQYQKAVDKARLAEVMPLVKNVKALQEVYFLHHGDYAANCEELGIDLPSGTFFNTSHFIEDNDGNFIIRCTNRKVSGILLNAAHSNAVSYEQFHDKSETNPGKIKCWANNENRYKRLCQSICNGELEEQFNAQGKNNGFSCEL